MFKLIVGLGNPGTKHEKDRHNAGFWLLDEIARLYQGNWQDDSKFYGQIAKIKLGAEDTYLLKPSTFMNRSGQAVAAISRFHKINPDSMLIIHDELDLKPGVARLKWAGGLGGHNGLKDIQLTLGTDAYPKLRFGIGNDFAKGQQIDFVLGRWAQKERKLIDIKIEKSVEVIESFATIGLSRTMTFANGLDIKED
jgi:PTH1 family peptidyl-tRNA hydrolase